ncbi:MAG: Fe-S protein assembly co-chaperone HscB [Terriglobia bacterium]
MKSLTADYFEFFELPRSLAIDPADLEKRFYAFSRELHPDRFARAPKDERDSAEETTAILNNAYRTLRDPVKRAMYLLKLEGFDIGEQGSKDVPPELLEEVFELNMALEESGDTSVLPRFEAMRAEIDGEIQALFAVWDAAHDRGTLTELRALLNRRKYITNLIEKANVPDRV